MYMAVGSFAAANFTIFGIFPQVYSKKWPKRDVENLPHLSIYVFDKNSQKKAWDCSPKHFYFRKETLGLQSQAFFLVPLGFKCFCLFGKTKKL